MKNCIGDYSCRALREDINIYALHDKRKDRYVVAVDIVLPESRRTTSNFFGKANSIIKNSYIPSTYELLEKLQKEDLWLGFKNLRLHRGLMLVSIIKVFHYSKKEKNKELTKIIKTYLNKQKAKNIYVYIVYAITGLFSIFNKLIKIIQWFPISLIKMVLKNK